MKFYKYHGLGNDYIVIDSEETGGKLSESQIRKICHRNFGVGSDGILFGPLETNEGDFGLRIFNPDGSEAEKSGNGLRIFSRYLLDIGRVGTEVFSIFTKGGVVNSRVHEGGQIVTVEMGKVRFDSRIIPVEGPAREVLNETVHVDKEELVFCAATVGNPHCIILREKALAEEAKKWGPKIEVDPRFPNKTNVQFMEIIDRSNIRIEIWERGAGYTLASGSSSTAAGAVAYRLGLCEKEINVHMPGGEIALIIDDDFSIIMTGPVAKIAEGIFADELFD
ncbi:MAG: diaminopimelate epimerase [Deltaproteobacteria bacterium]|nr:diaminopimelate epimerase [Deltaproteobacteria bacterium]